MTRITRAATTIGLCAAAGLAACGSPATTSPSSSASAAPSSSATGSSSPSSQRSNPAGIALTVAELPPGGPALTQISDGEMNNTANTDQRGFANTGNTYRIEDDVLLDTSSQAAAADYAQLRDATKGQLATVSSSSTPSGLGAQADEYIGKTSAGYSEVGITFQDGNVIAIVLIVDSSGTVAPAYAEAVARAQVQKIATGSD
ncbi:MAG: hypothetical protein WCB51_07795 [Candidatus Dormiibacterota bacterium]